jgi:tripartite-type tricarboxylate transporter receptor subunit TctC
MLPDVPTLAESGLPNYSFDAWLALIGPAGLPRPLAATPRPRKLARSQASSEKITVVCRLRMCQRPSSRTNSSR